MVSKYVNPKITTGVLEVCLKSDADWLRLISLPLTFDQLALIRSRSVAAGQNLDRLLGVLIC